MFVAVGPTADAYITFRLYLRPNSKVQPYLQTILAELEFGPTADNCATIRRMALTAEQQAVADANEAFYEALTRRDLS